MMNRPRLLRTLTLPSLLLLLCSSAFARQPNVAPPPPNILFFFVDDMGWQDTSVAFHRHPTELNRRYRTPNMERLAAEGKKFTQAYACAVCSPSRISLMTGMNAARHMVTNWTLRRNQQPDHPRPDVKAAAWNVNGLSPEPGVERTVHAETLPMLLRRAGYRTIHCGKAHFGAQDTPGEDPLNLGFDVNIAGHAAGGPGSYYGKYDFSAAWREGDRIWDVPGLEKYHGQDINLTEALTREAVAEIDRAVDENVPFYLYMSHYAIHAPWERDDRFHQKYLDAGLEGLPATYASMIESMDHSLGDLMRCLERRGIAENTVVVFMSDNGQPSQAPRNLPLRGHKLTPYEGGVRVPLIVKWPGVVEPDSRCENRYVIIEDIFPTFLEIAGVEAVRQIGGRIDGLSFVPLLRGATGYPSSRPVYWHFPNTYDQPPYSAVRQGDWKLIYHHAPRQLELFNLRDDLGERHDLSGERRNKTLELAALLSDFLRETKAGMTVDLKTQEPVEYPDQIATERGSLLPATIDPDSTAATPPTGVKPNIVFMLADDLGWTDLACTGSDLHETPHLDRLAREGVRFTQAYAMSVCSPTRAALLTGKHAGRLHYTIWREGSLRAVNDRTLIPPATVGNLPHAETTFAETLKAAGYLTFHVGKWHVGDAAHSPETHGFDLNVGGTHWGAPNTYFWPFSGAEYYREFRYVPGLGLGRPGDFLTDRLTDKALELIDQAGDRPFLLNLWFHSPHTPIEAKPDLVAHYEQRIRDGQRHRNPVYAAMIHSLDENVGRVLAKLDQRGLADRTLVVFTSDNGGYVNVSRGRQVTDNTPLRSGKGSLYEGGIRVPLLIRWPGVTLPGAVCDEPIVCMDLPPTFAAAAGTTLPTAIDGRNLTPLLRDPQARLDRDALFFHYPHYYPTTTPVSAVRVGKWKLLEFYEDHRRELYNLEADLSETRNLATARPKKADELANRLNAWRAAARVDLPSLNSNLDPTSVR